LASDFLQSVQSTAVSQIRVSDDNMPGRLPQWRIGKISLIAYALGMAPFKDIFWTTTVQEGNPYWGGAGVEPNPELHAIVSLLTAGPVGFGDKLGHTNKSLIMMTCTQNGTLLQPDHPAVSPDFVFRSFFAGNMPEVVMTGNTIGEFATKYILVTDSTEVISVPLSDITTNNNTRFVAWEYHHPQKNVIVDQKNALKINPTGGRSSYYNPPKKDYDPQYHPHALYTISKINSNGWSVLGEVNKFVSFSHRRFFDVQVTNGELNFKLNGIKGETVVFGFMTPLSGKPFVVSLQLEDGVTSFRCVAQGLCHQK